MKHTTITAARIAARYAAKAAKEQATADQCKRQGELTLSRANSALIYCCLTYSLPVANGRLTASQVGIIAPIIELLELTTGDDVLIPLYEEVMTSNDGTTARKLRERLALAIKEAREGKK